MARDLLLEIGMEEIPSRFVLGAVEQLAERMRGWLESSGLSHGALESYATPRRIAVLVKDLEERQQDRTEEVKGPSQKIAVDDAGNWTKAALGFARSQGVDPAELFLKDIGGVMYVHARKTTVGRETAEALPEALAQIVTSMSFPKNMRWGHHELRYVRPIRWICAMYGQDIVPMEIAGVRSGNRTFGHRFLGKEVALESASAYVSALRRQFVFADMEQRKRLILDQLNELASSRNWRIGIEEDLLEEVLFLVEYPTVLYGQFSPEFLEIPQEVLITSMREHQRYFPVFDEAGKLLPFFVTVRNGDTRSLDVVARGNEKVLRARLSDARFFYQEDQKLKIGDALEKLEKVVFHEELGTVGDKVRRIRANADRLADMIGVDGDTLAKTRRAADICKFDLVTQMVYEFPELQGIMGEDYARLAGEDPEVARAVFEHYQPRSASDSVPASVIGAIVSIADKIDTIAGCFSIGLVPTGSQDPYALRRQAGGIVHMLLHHRFPVRLEELFNAALDALGAQRELKRSREDIVRDLYEFFGLRVKHVLGEFARYDVVDACLARPKSIDRIPAVVRRAKALMERIGTESLKADVEAFNRVANLAAKADGEEIDPGLFQEGAEKELYKAAMTVGETIVRWSNEEGREAEILDAYSGLRDPINRFFEEVMVMVEDSRVRANRLALLRKVDLLLKLFADFQKLVLQ